MRALILMVAFVCVGMAACSGGGADSSRDTSVPRVLRVYSSPYASVAWESDLRLKAQHHTHAGVSELRLKAYDTAGYDAVSLMTYSGNPALSYAWTSRRWPPEAWLEPRFLASLESIKFFIPNGEEVGAPYFHFTSPFLVQYIEVWRPELGMPMQDWQYRDAFELQQVIDRSGGHACLAHPWDASSSYDSFNGLRCVEIYNAVAEAKRAAGDPSFTKIDANAVLVDNWDRALAKNQRLIGIAVNDHFGPDASSTSAPPHVLDSGHIVVLAKAADLESYQEAFDKGALLAVRDLGLPKGMYPKVSRISVEGSRIAVDTNGVVRWIADGTQVGEGAEFNVARLPSRHTYLRAEIVGSDSTTVYTQAFSLRPIGDVDGDGDVDGVDQSICDRVAAGIEMGDEYVSACAAVRAAGGG